MHTEHTMGISKLRIHIAPVGYEIDRIVLSAVQSKADRVWLLMHDKPNEDKAIPFALKIEEQLKKNRIQVKKEIHNRHDLFEIIRVIKEISIKESGNQIYLNLASGSKIQAVGLMMSAMMFHDPEKNLDIHPFYAEAENWEGFSLKKPLTTGVKSMYEIQSYKIKIPEPELVGALKIISKGRITKKKMAEIAEKEGLITVNAQEENHSQARFASLDKNIITKLDKKWNLIKVEKLGRNYYLELNENGKNAIKFL